MLSRGRSFVAPAYLFLCLILGGSAQGIWQNMLLQLVGIVIISWSALRVEGEEPLTASSKKLLLLGVALIAVVAIQLIPLPPALWTDLGPRQKIAEGFQVLGISMPREPLSLTPAASLDTLLAIIPPLALFCAMVRLRAYRSHFLAIALISGTIMAIGLGALQVATSGAELSPWYLYEETNPGKAVGFFANADHMASLLVITIPFLAAIVRSARSGDMQRYSAVVAITAAIALVIVIGLALNGSLAGYGLAVPVIAASALIMVRRHSRVRPWLISAVALLVLGWVGVLEATAIGSGKLGEHATNAVQSRAEILSTTWRAIRDFMPFGSGLGSFRQVYRLYENPELVTSVYVVHAHNDYAEVALELGLAGAMLIFLFLVWWTAGVWRAWRTPETRPHDRAASIASAAILIHSFVDFPLRTAAISASFAMCLALLAGSRAASPKVGEMELRPARHVEIS